ncbi:GspH/FimT family pseudopilin [Propionivibrio limicola]|uniref:GspH/FimT family pseudopilin n=1 Tax=Propionivibrio limicola TaxID=167645 RepID=UPI001292AD81|nr:GspH/FimT family pseudopilin [Propionivibrio limicola]
MPISARGCCKSVSAVKQVRVRFLEQGFTLIEILVACAIMAITLGVAMVKLEPSDSQRLNSAGESLLGRLEAARDEAVVGGRNVAFSSDGQGYQFWAADAERNAWVALPDNDTVASGRLAPGVSLSAIRVNGSPRPLGERLVFSSSGLAESFSLTLSSGNASLDIEADALGRLEIRRPL